MSENRYLKWLASETPTVWWHDSAIPEELEVALGNGAVGVTTNPFLIKSSFFARPDAWRPRLGGIEKSAAPGEKAEAIVRAIVTRLAEKLHPVFERSRGEQGLVCAQMNPAKAGDAEAMLGMARRAAKWAPNICIKLPATQAGLRVLETCVAEGMNVCATAGFSVSQTLAVAESHRKGLERAAQQGRKGGQCFAVVMVGRLDDYLRDVALDRSANISETDIIQAGTAVIKRAYALFKEHAYRAVLIPAGMRGAYHVNALAGAKMVMSIAPHIAAMAGALPEPWAQHIDEPVAPDVLARLSVLDEFVRAYEPEGLAPQEFITYGAVQKTLSQFIENGWARLETDAL